MHLNALTLERNFGDILGDGVPYVTYRYSKQYLYWIELFRYFYLENNLGNPGNLAPQSLKHNACTQQLCTGVVINRIINGMKIRSRTARWKYCTVQQIEIQNVRYDIKSSWISLYPVVRTAQ